MVRHKAGNSQSATACSVCLELVTDTCERSTAKLICGHQFHLDCIGSAFNAKGSMQCPNCRRIENGEWLYANGPRHLDNTIPENLVFEEDHHVDHDEIGGAPELFFPEDLMIGYSHWCPYREAYTRLSLLYGTANHHLINYAGLSVDVHLGEDVESNGPFPFVLGQAQASSRRAPLVENVGVQEGLAGFHHGAPYWQHFTLSTEELGPQSPAVFESIGVGEEGIGVHEEARLSESEDQLAGYIHPSQLRQRRLPAFTPSVVHIPANPMSAMVAARWDYQGTSAVRNAARLRNDTNVRQWRQQRSLRFHNSPFEGEGEPL